MDLALRRTLMWAFGGLALAALLIAVLVTVLAVESAPTWLAASFGLLVVAVIAEAVLLLQGAFPSRTPRAKRSTPGSAAAGPGAPHAVAAATSGAAPVARPAPAASDLLLRCSACSRTFTTLDDGHRPLATLCPHCGQRGVIDAPAA